MFPVFLLANLYTSDETRLKHIEGTRKETKAILSPVPTVNTTSAAKSETSGISSEIWSSPNVMTWAVPAPLT